MEFKTLRGLREIPNPEVVDRINRIQKIRAITPRRCGSEPAAHGLLVGTEANAAVALQCTQCAYVENEVPLFMLLIPMGEIIQKEEFQNRLAQP